MKLIDLPLHHAILIESNERTITTQSLCDELTKLSPVHAFFNHTVLDIETAREVRTWANTPYNEEKIAVLSFNTMGLEAQNLLLKVLEEPRSGVRFILVTTHTKHLISTVLSRVCIVRHTEKGNTAKDAMLFLETSHTSRMKLPYVTDILSRVDEESRKDRESVKEFIISLAEIAQQKQYPSMYTKEIFEIASYASDPSVSGKALIEYLALLLPQTKQ